MHLHRTVLLLSIIIPTASVLARGSASSTASINVRPSFEVVSIKPAKPGAVGTDSSFSGDMFTARNATLKSLIQYDAYEIPGPQILDIPAPLSNAGFDIQAKIDPEVYARIKALPPGESSSQYEQMIQQLLADHFKLVVHTETRQLPVYALVVTKGGSKLQNAKDPKGGIHIEAHRGQLSAKGVTTTELAKSLTRVLQDELGRIVLDQTGLTGRYDLVLRWTPQTGTPPMLNGEPDTSAPSIFTAIQEQLGLKLQATKGGVPVLVVDHAEVPSEN